MSTHSKPSTIEAYGITDSFRATFCSKYERKESDVCWPWKGIRDKDGYGIIFFNPIRQNLKAHRVAYWFQKGKLPPPNLLVCHKCDHPWCVNPTHLFLGTAKDNAQDSVRKGRRGDKQP